MKEIRPLLLPLASLYLQDSVLLVIPLLYVFNSRAGQVGHARVGWTPSQAHQALPLPHISLYFPPALTIFAPM